jgi:hypothetical protein
MKQAIVTLVALVSLAWGGAFAQTAGTPDAGELGLQISKRREGNANALRQYSWKTRTEVKSKGKTSSIKLELVRYDATGQLQKTPLAEPEKKKVRGPIRKSVAKSKRKKQREWNAELGELLAQYSLPSTGNLVDFLEKAVFSPDERDTIRVLATSVVQPGDELTWWLGREGKQLQRSKVRTTLDQDVVFMETTHRQLESGPVYASFTVIRVPSKDIEMIVENFDYTRQ